MKKQVVVVIFSCRHKKEFEARTNRALKWVLDNQINPIFIFTGNDFPPPGIIESVFGSDKIIWENVSKNTKENIRNTLQIVKIHWINDFRMVFVSSWYHIPRIKMLLKKEGIKIFDGDFIETKTKIKIINVLVEPFAYIAAKYDIDDYLKGKKLIKSIKKRMGYPI